MKEHGVGVPWVFDGCHASVKQGVRGAAGEQGLGVPHSPAHLPRLSLWRSW